ncbi:MAG: TetR/AcrR family transcriptional regulator, partial [Myxococcales bacterium]|nr:TetR/AcrR family transcriptional regulator [Myxococcales bacterium]
VAKGTLYLYFKTKEDLLLGIANRHQRQLLEDYAAVRRAGGSGFHQLSAMLDVYGRRMSGPFEHLKVIVARWATAAPFEGERGEGMRRNIRALYEAVVSTVERGQADGTIRDDLPAAHLALHLWSATNGALLMELQRGCMGKDRLLKAPSLGWRDHLGFHLDNVRSARRSDAGAVVGHDFLTEEAREA